MYRLALLLLLLISLPAWSADKYSCMQKTEHRQFFEEQDDQGEWKPWFDGYYWPLEATKLP